MRETLIRCLVVLLWTVHLSLAADLACKTDSEGTLSIGVTFSDSDFPTGFKSTNYALTSCDAKTMELGTEVEFGDGCNFDTSEAIGLVTYYSADPFLTQFLKWQVTCNLDTDQIIGLGDEFQVNIPAASAADLTSLLEVTAHATVASSYAVGDTVEFVVSLDQGYEGYAVIAIYQLTVNGIDFILNGCPAEIEIVPVLKPTVGQGTNTVVASWEAFFTDAFNLNGEVLYIEGTLKVCDIDSDACDFPVASCTPAPTPAPAPASCSDGGDCSPCDPIETEYSLCLCVMHSICVERKKREVTVEQTKYVAVDASTMVLLNTAQKTQYDQQLARTNQSAESSQLCVSKTVSVVVIVILIIGVIVCLLTTILMFFKMRTAQRRTSRKSDLTYSNKSFKM